MCVHAWLPETGAVCPVELNDVGVEPDRGGVSPGPCSIVVEPGDIPIAGSNECGRGFLMARLSYVSCSSENGGGGTGNRTGSLRRKILELCQASSISEGRVECQSMSSKGSLIEEMSASYIFPGQFRRWLYNRRWQEKKRL